MTRPRMPEKEARRKEQKKNEGRPIVGAGRRANRRTNNVKSLTWSLLRMRLLGTVIPCCAMHYCGMLRYAMIYRDRPRVQGDMPHSVMGCKTNATESHQQQRHPHTISLACQRQWCARSSPSSPPSQEFMAMPLVKQECYTMLCYAI